MLKHGEVNPLNVHGLRQLSWCPPDFERVEFPNAGREQDLSNWIYENLSGRFYIGITDDTDLRNRKTVAAFESPGEASYFSLCLTNIVTIHDNF